MLQTFLHDQSKKLTQIYKHNTLTSAHLLYIALESKTVSNFLLQYFCKKEDLTKTLYSLDNFFKILEKDDPAQNTNGAKYSTGDYALVLQLLDHYENIRQNTKSEKYFNVNQKIGFIDVIEILLSMPIMQLHETYEVFSVKLLENLNLTHSNIVFAITDMCKKNNDFSFIEDDDSEPFPRRKIERADNGEKKKTNNNDELTSLPFLHNMIHKVKKGKIDPVFGREDEIGRITQILIRRTKSNPILVGEAGVGKTAVIEGLAYDIFHNRCHELLSGFNLYSLDVGGLLSGTTYRGDLERKVNELLNFLKKNQKTILFIDEMHMLMGAGSNNAMDVSNLLKPALSRGEVKIIGATTYREYKEIMKDPAFARRTHKVDIKEPSKEDTIKIITSMKSVFEKHHDIQLTQKIIEKSVDLSAKYLTNRFFPDKAIDVLDEAGAYTVFNKLNKTISAETVEKVIAKMANIPEKTISSTKTNKLKNLKSDLKSKIIGQDHVIDAVVDVIELASAGVRKNNKPMGSFLFAGPTGVGKTELAIQTSNAMGINFLRIDMSEFDKEHSSEKLIGSPPGYVGYGEGGILTNFVQKNPNSMILFDEFDKAHPKVKNYLLQIMDNASLMDGSGVMVDFKNTILVMTSNDGQAELFKKGIGLSDSVVKRNEQLKSSLDAINNSVTPEFRNRLDKVLVFNQLEMPMVKNIAKIIIDDLVALINSNNDSKINIVLDEDVENWLVKHGYDSRLGARPMNRLIENVLAKPIAKEILYNKNIKNGVFLFFIENDEIKYNYVNKNFLKQRKKIDKMTVMD